MTNTELLEQAIKDSGLKKGFIADKIGLSRTGFNNCIKNEAEFKQSQIAALCRLLGIKKDKRDAIFFAEIGG